MKKILIIDDDKDLNRLTKIVLTHEGYEVEILHDAESGINYARVYKPDLILMDVLSPGMRGTDAAKRIKTDDLSDQIQIIFLTASVSPRTKPWEEGLNVDGLHYPTIGKPYEIEKLLQTVNKVLGY